MEAAIKSLIFKDRENNQDATWLKLGINSLEYIKLIINIENEFNFEISDDFLIYKSDEKIEIFIENVLSEIKKKYGIY